MKIVLNDLKLFKAFSTARDAMQKVYTIAKNSGKKNSLKKIKNI